MANNTSVLSGDRFANISDDPVKNGRYASTNEVARAALRLLEQEDTKLDLTRETLAHEMQLNQGQRGKNEALLCLSYALNGCLNGLSHFRPTANPYRTHGVSHRSRAGQAGLPPDGPLSNLGMLTTRIFAVRPAPIGIASGFLRSQSVHTVRTGVHLLVCLLALLLTACDSSDGGRIGVSDADTVTASIGPAGGSITSMDGKLRLDVPAGALAAAQDISIRAIAPGEADAALQLFAPVNAYRLLPDGLLFTLPARATLQLDQEPTIADAGTERRISFIGPLGLLQASGGVVNALETSNTIGSDGSERFEAVIEHFSDLVVTGRIEGLPVDDTRHFTTSLVSYPRQLQVGASGSIVIELKLKSTRSYADDFLTLIRQDEASQLQSPDLQVTSIYTTLIGEDFRREFSLTCTEAGTFDFVLLLQLPNILNRNGDTVALKPNVLMTLTITCIPAANRAPTATSDSYSTPRDTTLTIAAPGFLGNDTDPDGDMLSGSSATRPTNGQLNANIAGGFVYAPTPGFTGRDSFSYTVSDGRGGASTATVSIDVFRENSPPFGAADRYGTTRDTILVVNSPGILENDNDSDDNTVERAVLDVLPTNGTLTRLLDLSLVWTGGFNYTPNTGFVGIDRFTYRPIDRDDLPGEVTEVVIDVTAPISNVQARLIALGAGVEPFSPEGLVFVPQTVARPFPVPGASSVRLPIIVAGNSPTVSTDNNGAITQSAVVAVDAASGEVMHRYYVAGTLYDAVPLQGQVEEGGVVDRRIGLLASDGESELFIFSNGTEGGRVLGGPPSAGSDVSYLSDGEPLHGYVVTLADGTIFARRYRANPFAPTDLGLFADPSLFNGSIVGTRPENPRSAVANVDATRFVVAGVSPTLGGQLHFVHRVFESNDTTSDTVSTIGNLGPNPRRMRCGALPAPQTDVLCAVSDFTADTVTLFTWDGDNAPVLGPTVPVGDGPVGIDVFDGMVLSTGYNDDTFTLVQTPSDDPLAADPVVTTRALADIPAVAGCDAPGHAIFLRDEDRRIALSCNLSGQIAIVPDAFPMPSQR